MARGLKEGMNRMNARSYLGRAVLAALGATVWLVTAPQSLGQTDVRPNMVPAISVSNGYVEANVGSLFIADDADIGSHPRMAGKIHIANTGGEPLVATDHSRMVTATAAEFEDYWSAEPYIYYIDQYATLAVANGDDSQAGTGAGNGDPFGWNYFVFGEGDGVTAQGQWTVNVDGVNSAVQNVAVDAGDGADEPIVWYQILTPYRDKVRIRWIVSNQSTTLARVVKLRFRHRPAPLGAGGLLGREQTKVYIDGYGWTDEERDFWTSGTSEALPKRWVTYSPEGEMAVGWTNVADARDRNMVTPAGDPIMDAPPQLEGIRFQALWHEGGHPVWFADHPPGGKLTDMGLVVHYYWKSVTLQPGESQAYDIWLGDEWSASDNSDPLAVASSARSAVGLTEDSTTGETVWDLGTTQRLRVGGSITNRWSSPMRNGSLTISLPEGLTLASGQTAARTVPTLEPGETGEVTWELVPDPDFSLSGDVSWVTSASAAAAGGVYTKSLANSISFPALSRIRTAPPVAPPGTDDRPGYQYLMMSVPFGLDDPDPLGGLSYKDLSGNPVVPRVWRYDPEQNAWDAYPNGSAGTLKAGYGYFVRVPVRTDISVPTDGTARYLNSVTETNVPLLGRQSGTGAYTGFNQVGNPYTYSLSLGEVKFVSRGVTYTYDQSWAAGWLPGVLWEWDPTANSGRGGYILQYGRDFAMAPWKAYWLLANTDLEMIMSPPDVRGATPPTGTLTVTPPVTPSSVAGVSSRSCLAKATGANSAQDWLLQITGECAEAADTTNFIGASSAVSAGANQKCVLEPPPVGRYLQVAFPHQDWGRSSGLYALDVRPSGTEAEFDMTVTTTVPKTDVTLGWPTIGHLPRELSLTLIDLDSGERVFMRTASSYTFASGDEGGTRHFRIRVSSRERGLQITDLAVDSVARGAAITYALSDDAEVDVVVLNSAGRVVRTLSKGESVAAGRSVVNWDGRSDAGSSAPSGEYRIQLEARSLGGGRVTRTAALSLR
jgi:hypothetical protein